MLGNQANSRAQLEGLSGGGGPGQSDEGVDLVIHALGNGPIGSAAVLGVVVGGYHRMLRQPHGLEAQLFDFSRHQANISVPLAGRCADSNMHPTLPSTQGF